MKRCLDCNAPIRGLRVRCITCQQEVRRALWRRCRRRSMGLDAPPPPKIAPCACGAPIAGRQSPQRTRCDDCQRAHDRALRAANQRARRVRLALEEEDAATIEQLFEAARAARKAGRRAA